MKKSYLITGIVYVCIGAVLLCVALSTQTRLESLLWGFTGATICPGIATILRYFYWSHPDNRARYEERLENERIELHDELKCRLRDQSGRLAYVAGLLAVCVSMVAFTALEAFGVIESARLIVLFLAGYLVFELVAGVVIFRYLMRKY